MRSCCTAVAVLGRIVFAPDFRHVALLPDFCLTYSSIRRYRRFADEATRARMVVSAVDETLSVSELLLLLREGGVLANGGRPTSIQNPIEAAAAAAAAAEAAAAAAAREKAEAEAALDKAGKGGKKGKGKKSSAKAKSPQKTPKKGGKGAAAAEAEAAAKAEEDARLAAEVWNLPAVLLVCVLLMVFCLSACICCSMRWRRRLQLKQRQLQRQLLHPPEL